MIRFILSQEDIRRVAAAARALRTALPIASTMKRAAIGHLRTKGGVRFPMEALSPRPGAFLQEVLELAKTGRQRPGRVFVPIEVLLRVHYEVPVEIDTPWGTVLESVTLERAFGGKTWTCSSASVTTRLLKMRAIADRYRLLHLVLRDESSARDVLAAARGTGGLLRFEKMKLDDGERDAIAKRRPPAPHSYTTIEYLRVEKDMRSSREIKSRTMFALTAAQRRASRKLSELANTVADARKQEVATDFELTRARIREIEMGALANTRRRRREAAVSAKANERASDRTRSSSRSPR